MDGADAPAFLAGLPARAAACAVVRADEPDAAAALLFLRAQPGGVLLRRAAEGGRALVALVRLRRDLRAPLGDPDRDVARVSHRHGARRGVRAVARARAGGFGDPRSVHQGDQCDAAGDPRAYL